MIEDDVEAGSQADTQVKSVARVSPACLRETDRGSSS